jgi:mono/diheme cytochrome c family protein
MMLSMNRSCRFCVAALALALIVAFASKASAEAEAGLAREVRSILSNNCFQCHGPDENERQADLRLDTQDGAYAVIVPGEPEESELLRRIVRLRDVPPR